MDDDQVIYNITAATSASLEVNLHGPPSIKTSSWTLCRHKSILVWSSSYNNVLQMDLADS